MNGYELARRLRAICAATRLIALTGYGQASDLDAALAAGFDTLRQAGDHLGAAGGDRPDCPCPVARVSFAANGEDGGGNGTQER